MSNAYRKSEPADFQSFPNCTIDFPLDFSPEEIASVAAHVNLLLKCNSLLDTPADFGDAVQSLFDLAFGVAPVGCCAYISGSPDENDFRLVAGRRLPPRDPSDDDSLFLPAAVARFFNKAVCLETGKGQAVDAVCREWESTSLLALPIRRNLEFAGALVFGKSEPGPFSRAEVKLLWVLAGYAEGRILQSEAVRTLFFYSYLDPLTHLHNRRHFDDALEKEIHRSRRSGKSIALLRIDLDGFRAYNDSFGSPAGDIALQEVAVILQNCVREVDLAARIGADEFAIILCESGSIGARDLGRRIHERLRRHLFPGRDHARTERLSASIGIASFPADAFDRDDLLNKSDYALQAARRQGGGRVCLHQEIPDLISARPGTPEFPVRKIFDAAKSVLNMDGFMEILLFTAMQGMSACRGSIVVVEPGGEFSLRVAVGFGDGEEMFVSGANVPAGAVSSWVVRNGKPLVVSGGGESPVPIRWKRNGYRGDSFLSIPLMVEERVLGVLHLTNRTGNIPFTSDDLAAFEPMSREIASLLSRGMRFREHVRTFALSMLRSIKSALELRFPFYGGHGNRTRDICLRIGRTLGIPEEGMSSLATAAELHDVGIVGIPGDILCKSRKFDPREQEIVRKHPFLGAKLLEGIPGMEEAGRIILEHQEYYDGSGYPYGLRGEEISEGARILSLAEFYDSIMAPRPHRGGLSHEEAIQLVRNNSNTLFEERVCQAFLSEYGKAATS